MTGILFDIQRFCVHDGPGIRTTVFMKGCPLRCRWCHNPEGLTAQPQAQFFEDECIGCGRCGGLHTAQSVNSCLTGALKIVGKAYSPEALLDEVLKDRDFYGSEGGVTFSGGECLLQADFIRHMLVLLKTEGVSTAIDTCGAVSWEAFEKVLPLCDTFLYDVKCASDRLHREYTGSGNRLILENLKKLSDAHADIRIRIPVIPGFNDSREEMAAIGALLRPLSLRSVTLIPYHTLGKSKYKTLGLTPGYNTDKSVTKEQLINLKAMLEALGLPMEDR